LVSTVSKAKRVDAANARSACRLQLLQERYPDVRSTTLLSDEHHSKWLTTSRGGDSLSSIQRALCYVTLMSNADDGNPVN
jgi:hypothetical protein